LTDVGLVTPVDITILAKYQQALDFRVRPFGMRGAEGFVVNAGARSGHYLLYTGIKHGCEIRVSSTIFRRGIRRCLGHHELKRSKRQRLCCVKIWKVSVDGGSESRRM
jgi:hypothetical protein